MIFLAILIQEYLERINMEFVLIYVLLLRIERHRKILMEKKVRDQEKFENTWVNLLLSSVVSKMQTIIKKNQ